MSAIPGLHHVTAICGPAQANLDFYAGVLRQRLVKRTVNFDAPDTYHLYYGDRTGSPGTIMTFFPFADAAPGRAGPGTAGAVAYAVDDLDGWMMRLAEAGVDFSAPETRLGERLIALADPDGLKVELIEATAPAPSADDAVPAVGGFHSVTLTLRGFDGTTRVLRDLFGYEEVGHESGPDGAERLRLRAPGGGPASVIDLVRAPDAPPARPGAGTIHHVAFRAADDEAQRGWRERLSAAGFAVSPVTDRQYFNAIYFREPGGVLFEIATDPPGFAVDEEPDALGTALKLPAQHEPRRAAIEGILVPLRLPDRGGPPATVGTGPHAGSAARGR